MPGKLYIKIFLSFLLILVVTEVLVFGLFIMASGRSLRGKFTQYTGAKVQLVKELFEEKMTSQPGVPLTGNAPLKDFMTRFGGTFDAKLWLTASDGSPLMKSFPGDIPKIDEKMDEKRMRDFGDFKLYYSFRKHFESIAMIPMKYPDGESGNLYVLFEEMGTRHSHGFGPGLFGIGIIVALLTIPISRLITGRVKKLRTSAIKIAEGDLSHRAMIKGKDEIGELGRAFNRMADKLERMIRGNQELTANISHELRTPLARIRIAEELLREKIAQKDIQSLERYLEDIREDIEALDHLIGRILDLSRLDLKDSPAKKEAFDPEEMVRGLLDRLSPAIGRRGLQIHTTFQSETAFFGDRENIGTALSNILDNAVKYTPENGVIRVRLSSGFEGLDVRVTNTSGPFSEEDLSRIFEPFYRLENARAKGTGLGLAITKKIVEKHGGTVQAGMSEDGFEIHIHLPSEHDD